MNRSIKAFLTSITACVMAVSLSGCIVAAIPLIMVAAGAGVALTGFVVYKSVQTSGGGNVRVAFGSTEKDKATPPQPLPTARDVSVWPGGQREIRLVEKLQAANAYRSVNLVRGVDAGGLGGADDQRAKAFDGACATQPVDLIFAAVDLGEKVDSNMLSFKRGSLTHKLNLVAYSCAQHKAVWVDAMAVIVESGNNPTPQAEIDNIAADAWADRLAMARGG